MKMFLLIPGSRTPLHLPHKEADHAIAAGACPKCNASPWGVQGTGRRPSVDGRAWEADGITTCCKQFAGIIRWETDTLFGVREDELVLSGRCRVY